MLSGSWKKLALNLEVAQDLWKLSIAECCNFIVTFSAKAYSGNFDFNSWSNEDMLSFSAISNSITRRLLITISDFLLIILFY